MVDEDGCGCGFGVSASEFAGAFVSGESEGPYLVPSLDGIGPLLPALRLGSIYIPLILVACHNAIKSLGQSCINPFKYYIMFSYESIKYSKKFIIPSNAILEKDF